MKTLFTNYSISDIIIFTITLALAVKGLVTFFDWCASRIRQHYDKDYDARREKEDIEEQIHDLNKFYGEKKKVDDTFAKIDNTFIAINKRIDMLVESDKESIKSYIVDKHHHFVYSQGWIDDYSLECLENRFMIYKEEHGNSFVEGLMNELRSLPKQPPQDIEYKYIGTAEYVKKARELKE